MRSIGKVALGAADFWQRRGNACKVAIGKARDVRDGAGIWRLGLEERDVLCEANDKIFIAELERQGVLFSGVHPVDVGAVDIDIGRRNLGSGIGRRYGMGTLRGSSDGIRSLCFLSDILLEGDVAASARSAAWKTHRSFGSEVLD